MDYNRAFAKLEQKLSSSVGHRVDLQFADVRKINASTAHFMLAYTDVKIPSSDELAEFFVRKYNAKITPFLSTARVYKAQKVVTVVAQILSITRDIEDTKKSFMKPVIEGAVYLDVPLQETWEVTEREGTKVLVRKVKDDIIALVNARKKTMMDSYSSKTFASLITGDNITRYLSILDKGDYVRVLINEKVVEAEVVSVKDDQVKIKYKGGMSSVPRQNVLEIVGKNPAMQEKIDQEMIDYFAQAYGDEKYAEEMV